MRILLVTQYFDPENFKSNDIAYELAKRGHRVDALCGIPNYPEGKYFKGYGVFKKRHERVNGVNIFRCFQTPRGKNASPIGLSLNYISFVISATIWVMFFFAWRKKYDAIITHEPSPITQIIPAIILGKIRNIPVYSWLMDIWPDSVVSTIGESKSKYIKPILSATTNWVYKNSKKILITSKGMAKLVNRDADYSDKIIHYPNWSDDMLSDTRNEMPRLPDGYKIMMVGTINDGIGIPAIVSLLDELKDVKGLQFVFVGGGGAKDALEYEINNRGISNAVLMGRFPSNMMPSFFSQADALLLSLKKNDLPHLKSTIPARLQSYMSAGKPVLAMIDGDAEELIKESDCGLVYHAGAYKDLAEAIREKVLSNPANFAKKGIKGREYYLKYFTKEKCISNLEKIIS